MLKDITALHGEHKPNVVIPNTHRPSTSCEPASPSGTSIVPMTPKTPADEALDFFSSTPTQDDGPVRIYELRLDPDGGPNKDRQVSCSPLSIPPIDNPLDKYIRLPPAYSPYILRVSFDSGTPASNNGVFKTNFPLDGGVFGRERYAEREYVLSRRRRCI